MTSRSATTTDRSGGANRNAGVGRNGGAGRNAGAGRGADDARLAPVHPGEVLAEEFLRPMGLSSRALAERIGVPPNRVSMIAAGKRGITGDTALRFAEAFGTTPEFWMNLQKSWELAVARDAQNSPK